MGDPVTQGAASADDGKAPILDDVMAAYARWMSSPLGGARRGLAPSSSKNSLSPLRPPPADLRKTTPADVGTITTTGGKQAESGKKSRTENKQNGSNK